MAQNVKNEKLSSDTQPSEIDEKSIMNEERSENYKDFFRYLLSEDLDDELDDEKEQVIPGL